MSNTVLYQTDTSRLKRVKINRQFQLQRWNYNEMEYQKNQKNNPNKVKEGIKKRIEFSKDIILLEAVSRNDIQEVRELLNQGVNPNAATIDGLTGLHQCCIDDFREMAELLIKHKANVNAVDSEMWTPLHAAATCDNAQMCILLSKHGSNFLALNSDGNMPYDICEGGNALKIIEEEMGKKGIKQHQIDDARMVPEQRMLKDLKKFLETSNDLDELDCQGAALIHIGCSLGYNDVVQTLLEAGANYSLPDKDGWLPIHLAACWSHVDIVEFLVVFGADIDSPNSSGDTIFDLCETEIRDRLLYIKENISEIRKNHHFKRPPSHKSFRRSRGSSVRRTSVRQKNMFSKKEAKDEFIALTQTISSSEETPNQVEDDSTSYRPSTIEENNDMDGSEINVEAPKVTVQALKMAEKSSKQTIPVVSNERSSIRQSTPVNNKSSSNINGSIFPNNTSATVEDKSKSKTDCQTKMENKNTNHSNHKNEEPQKNDHTLPRRTANSEDNAFEKPKYVFTSTTDNWDNNNVDKRIHRRECCHLL